MRDVYRLLETKHAAPLAPSHILFLVFNELLLRILADKQRMRALLLRFCLELLRDYDLTQYRALKTREMAKTRITRRRIAEHLRELQALGILERGPSVRAGRSKWMTPTYRLAPRFLMTPLELKTLEAEHQAVAERMSLLPPAIEE